MQRSLSLKSTLLPRPKDFINRAITAIEEARVVDAERDLTTALGLPHIRQIEIVNALLLRSSLRSRVGKIEESERDLRSILTLEPQNARALKRLETLSGATGGIVTPSTSSILRTTRARHGFEGSASSAEGSSSLKARRTVSFAHSLPRRRDIPLPLQSRTRKLPYEIWLAVASYLPVTSLQSWLSVSRFLHDIALPIIFRRVSLQFGMPPDLRRQLIPEWQRKSNRTVEIVDRILSDREFAANIRTLVVHANNEDVASECSDALRDCIPRLTSLTSFSWKKGSFELDSDLSRLLSTTVPRLENLYVCGNQFQASGIRNLRSLRRLHVVGFHDSSQEKLDDIRAVLHNNQDTLRDVRLSSWLVWERIFSDSFSPDRLEHLHLSAVNTIEVVMDAFATQATNLQSLILSVQPHPSFALSAVFNTHPNAFPRLRQLHVCVDDRLTFDFGLYSAVGNFLLDKPLERLHITEQCSSERPLKVFRIAQESLKGLKAFRLDVPKLSAALLRDMIDCVPLTIEALYIEAQTRDSSLVDLATTLTAFTSLSTLVINVFEDTFDFTLAHRRQGSSSSTRSVRRSHSTFKEPLPVPAGIPREAHAVAAKRGAERVAAAFASLDVVGVGGLEFLIKRGARESGRLNMLFNVEPDLEREHSLLRMGHSDWVRRRV
ncbi:hypothetical protein BOTBODRAFT_569579 [Botryobasidium botryosum FD-172 SS1]|uniref:F-box domain-containing protein n=1 Tax=Botryobasidium botryosum (strain FD-172 SS1) TaxID=930990 RepID=A0A067LYA1_BOTB1|nr:hypothetical protein BOTBODRAFT_569579 [Botryobasidium botryosum FD-172 SS1]